MEIPQELPSASLLRLFIAIIYDSLLLLSVLIFATVLVLVFALTPEQISQDYKIFFQFYLLMVCFFYFSWPWLRSGQTLGMKAWRLQVQSIDGNPLTWRQVSLRFFMAIVSGLLLGMGFFWAIVDKQHRTWHDRVSDTRIVLRPA